MQCHFPVVLLETGALPARHQTVGAATRLEGFDQNQMQVAAVNGKLRPVVTGVAPRRLGEDMLAVTVVEAGLPRGDRHLGQRLLEAELAHLTRSMRQKIDPDAERLQFRSGFINARSDALLMKHECERQAADASTYNRHFHRLLPSPCENSHRPPQDGAGNMQRSVCGISWQSSAVGRKHRAAGHRQNPAVLPFIDIRRRNTLAQSPRSTYDKRTVTPDG